MREAALLLVDVGTADHDVSKAPRDNSVKVVRGLPWPVPQLG